MCDCGCNNCGPNLMGYLGALLPAGSQVKTGFIIELDWSIFGSAGSATDLQNAIEGCVYSSGGFNAVSVAVNGSYLSNSAYVTVAVETYYDHANLEDVGDWLRGIIQGCLPGVQVTFQDRTVGVTTTDAAGNPLPQGNAPNQPGQPSQCDWSKMKWSDYLACQLGITPSSAALVGLGIGAVGVIAIASLARR